MDVIQDVVVPLVMAVSYCISLRSIAITLSVSLVDGASRKFISNIDHHPAMLLPLAKVLLGLHTPSIAAFNPD